MIVKFTMIPSPGSGKFKKTKRGTGFYESGIGIFGHDDGHHVDSHGGHGHSGDD